MAGRKRDVLIDTKPATVGGAKADAKSRLRERKLEQMARLVKNDDFCEWLFLVLAELCAFGDDLALVDEWHQGLRSAGAYMRRVLLEADGAAEMLAKLQQRYLEGVRRGILDEAAKRENENGGRR